MSAKEIAGFAASSPSLPGAQPEKEIRILESGTLVWPLAEAPNALSSPLLAFFSSPSIMSFPGASRIAILGPTISTTDSGIARSVII